MVDDRIVTMSAAGFKSMVEFQDGKGFHWTCDVNTELPIKMSSEGPGSEEPITLPMMFLNAVKLEGDRNSLLVERDGEVLVWTWN